MKEIETEKGVLKYDMPSVPQCLDILHIITKKRNEDNNGALKIKKDIIENCSALIDHESLGYKSFTELGKDAKNMAIPLSKIADEIYNYVMDVYTVDKKK